MLSCSSWRSWPSTRESPKEHLRSTGSWTVCGRTAGKAPTRKRNSLLSVALVALALALLLDAVESHRTCVPSDK